MKFSFDAKICKVGINPCVKVPFSITDRMVPAKGYIPVKGKIGSHPFKQTLVPVKHSEFRLYVNGAMLKGGHASVGDVAHFTIEQDHELRKRDVPMNNELKKHLAKNHVAPAFAKLTPSRQKDILKYLNHLKTPEALSRNIDRIISDLKNKTVKKKYP
jgi:hypothetical protein